MGVSMDDALARFCKGDMEALSEVVERCQGRLYGYLARIVHDPATAEDLFQQTWVRVAEKIKSYDRKRSFEVWLFTIARNLALDFLRRYRPESLDEPLPSGGSRMEFLASSEPGALEVILGEENAGYLERAVKHLPVIYREVLALRFEEELKLEEIAAVLAVPLSTVKSRLRRALEELRQTLPGEVAKGLEHERAQ